MKKGCVNPIPLRTAKTLWSFGRSECNRVESDLTSCIKVFTTGLNGLVLLHIQAVMLVLIRLLLFYCFTPRVNSCGHYGTVSQPYFTIPEQAYTS